MFHQSDKYPANSLSFYLAVVLSRQYISRICSFHRALFLAAPYKFMYIVYCMDYRGL